VGTALKLVGDFDTAPNGVSLVSAQYDVEDENWYGVVSSGFA
jgi:hypothetical protein